MPANCCNDTLQGKIASAGRQVVCWGCGTVWTGRAGKWVTEGGAR